MKTAMIAVAVASLGWSVWAADGAEAKKTAPAALTHASPKAKAEQSAAKPERKDARTAARKLAQERFAKDAEKFDLATRREIETLYRKSSAKDADAAARALKTLVEKYPEANRTGCAVMYAAQRSRNGAERERLLKLAIEKFGGCFYGDGAQVAPYARWYLAKLYAKTGKADEAKKLFDEIRAQYPEAVTHRGGKFSEYLPK